MIGSTRLIGDINAMHHLLYSTVCMQLLYVFHGSKTLHKTRIQKNTWPSFLSHFNIDGFVASYYHMLYSELQKIAARKLEMMVYGKYPKEFWKPNSCHCFSWFLCKDVSMIAGSFLKRHLPPQCRKCQ